MAARMAQAAAEEEDRQVLLSFLRIMRKSKAEEDERVLHQVGPHTLYIHPVLPVAQPQGQGWCTAELLVHLTC